MLFGFVNILILRFFVFGWHGKCGCNPYILISTQVTRSTCQTGDVGRKMRSLICQVLSQIFVFASVTEGGVYGGFSIHFVNVKICVSGEGLRIIIDFCHRWGST